MGGSGGYFSGRSPDTLRRLVERQESKTRDAAFLTELAGVLSELLGGYNARDSITANDRLEELKVALSDTMDGSFDSFFGGSVAKHTYVDGLSDVDSLFLINDSSLDGKPPAQVLERMRSVISKCVGDDGVVSHGRMAVTVEYDDGMMLQILPAIKERDGHVRVPSSRDPGRWSKIDPVGFNQALTRANSECSGKLVPTIKLAKAIIASLPENQRLSGYHVESLAISAFRNYDGEKTTTAMLPHFFAKARDAVLSPIRDRSGQSVHVDGYLGQGNSEARVAASHNLGRIERKMRNATNAESVPQWRALFGLDND
jgi:hypothetical protein